MSLTSFVFTELANTMKYGGGVLYNLVFIERRHRVSQNSTKTVLYKPWIPNGYFRFEIIINDFFPDSFEYLCYGSTAILNMFTLTVRGPTLVVRI